MGHGGEQRALAAADEIAGADKRGADHAVDGRSDRRVAEVEPRRLDRGDLRRHLGPRRFLHGERVVELLLADGLFGHERLIPLHVVVGLRKPGLGRLQIRLRVGDMRLEGLSVDAIEAWPFRTIVPSANSTVSRYPSTRARISTS